MTGNGLRVLIGWKEIANYLGCSTSTAVRRVDDGLPVFRVGGSVRAFVDDIDRWLEGERIRKLEEPPKAETDYPGIVVNREELGDTMASFARERKDERFAVIPLGIDTSKYENIELRLKTAEEKYRWLLETVPVWIWETNADGEYTYSNVAIRDILGYRPEELAGFKPVEFLVAPADVEIHKNETDNLRQNKRVIRDFQCRYIHRDTSIKWLETDAEPIFESGGEFSGIRGVSRDITVRKRVEAALRQSEGQYRTLSENIPVGVFRMAADPTGRIISANPALARMFGFDRPEDMVGERIADFYADPTRRSGFVGAVAVKGEITNFEARLKRRDGSEFCGSFSARVGRGEDDAIVHYDGVCEDVTERRRVETALRKSEHEKTVILESMAELVVYVGRNLEIIWVNQAAARWAGAAPEDMVGRPCFEAWYERSEMCAECHVKRAIETGEPQELELTTADGSIWHVQCNPVRDEEDGICGAVEVSLDITERKRAEEALRETLTKNDALLEAIPDLMFILKRDGTCVDFKRGPAELFALPPDQLIGANIRDIGFSQADERRAFEAIEETIRTGKTSVIEYELPIPGGLKTFEARLAKLDDDRVISVVRDITEIKKAERARAELVFEKAAAAISREFIRARNMDEAVEASLEIMVNFNGAGRSYLLTLSEDGKEITNTYERLSPGVGPRPEELRRVPTDPYVWGTAQLRQGEPLSISDVRALPHEAAAEKKTLEELGVKAVLVLPLFTEKDELRGFVGFDNCTAPGDWKEVDLDLLRYFAETWQYAVSRNLFE
ncbi:MAG: PAS domain S-box protein [Candidatus Zixiibacteriota bacterium]|jgi:PAS domain S-box-containing protein